MNTLFKNTKPGAAPLQKRGNLRNCGENGLLTNASFPREKGDFTEGANRTFTIIGQCRPEQKVALSKKWYFVKKAVFSKIFFARSKSTDSRIKSFRSEKIRVAKTFSQEIVFSRKMGPLPQPLNRPPPSGGAQPPVQSIRRVTVREVKEKEEVKGL